MQRRPFGKTGLMVSAVGFGAAEVGYAGDDAKLVREVLDAAFDAGVDVVDTAECYGTSEQTLGTALAGRRERVKLFSKCGHSYSYEDPDWHDRKRLRETLERTLKRLRTDRLDLLLLHSCPKAVLDHGGVIEFLREAKRAGKTRFIGYSGDGDAALCAVKSGAFDALQTSFNLADQEALDKLLPQASRKGLAVIVKRPLANAAWRYDGPPENAYHQPYWERLKALDYPFLRGADAAENALRFALSAPGVSTAIVGTRNPARWAGLARATSAKLPDEEWELIRTRWSQIARADWVGQT